MPFFFFLLLGGHWVSISSSLSAAHPPEFSFGLLDDSEGDNTTISPRASAIIGMIESHNTFVIIGGSQEADSTSKQAWIFNTNTQTWSSFDFEFPLTGRPAFAQLTSPTSFRHPIYIFGGRFNGTLSKSLYEYSHPQLRLLGEGPSSICSEDAAATVTKEKLIIFGGQEEGECSNELSMYDFDSNSWTQYSNHTLPPPRMGASLVAYANEIIMFGGYCDNSYYGDVWRFSVDSLMWSQDPSSHMNYSDLKRAFHSAFLGNSHYLYVFGGSLSGNRSSISNEFFEYDLQLMKWRNFTALEVTLPAPRERASMIYVSPRAFLFGGESPRGYLQDTWQIVLTAPCSARNFSCEQCVASPICGWCYTNTPQTGYGYCIPGNHTNFYGNTCPSPKYYLKDSFTCPERNVPAWVFGILLVGFVLLLGLLVYSFIKFRGRTLYQPVMINDEQ